jgi:Protein kinase domain
MSKYELRGVLGRGGMAVVYEARRVLAEDISMPVAVKCLRPDIRHDREVWHRFAQEALLGFSLNNSHPNLVTIYDLIEDEERNLWIVMDLVRGCSPSRSRRDRRAGCPTGRARQAALRAATPRERPARTRRGLRTRAAGSSCPRRSSGQRFSDGD